MSAELKERKALADRELASKFLGSTSQYERALQLGFVAGMITDPMARRVVEATSKHYRAEGRVVPSPAYLKDHGIPFHEMSSSDTVEQTLARVRDMAVQLRVIAMADRAATLVLRSPAEAAEQLSEEIRGIAELSKLRAPLPDQSTLVAESMSRYEVRKVNSLGDAIPLVWSPITDITHGKAKGYPSFIYGPSKSYKTTLMLWDAYWTATQGYRTYVGTGEWKPQDITDLMLCFHAEVPLARFRDGKLFPDEEMRLSSAIGSYKDLPLEIGPKSFPGVQELDMVAARADQFGAEVVYLDGAHRLPKSRNHEDVAEYAQRVTEHAGRMDRPWFVAVQANRYGRKTGKSDDAKKVDSSSDDVGGSIAWTQECNFAIRCVKEDYGRVTMEVTDSRFGDVGSVEVSCQPGIAMHVLGGRF